MMLKPKNAAWSARAACYGLARSFDEVITYKPDETEKLSA